uniref:Uncharacterized protein n=1 Tax=Romanomermis culicivorax TaxID=13658 RepID=A0A915JVE5_ROMCU
MAYQMVQQIKQNDTINAVGTGVFIALDVAKCVLEAMAEFGILALNPWVIPAMMIGNVAILIGQNIYDTVKKIKEIDHVVHLSTDEYMYEFVREFLKMGTDPYIQHLADEKQANEQVASKLFEIYPNIKRFVVSAAIYNEHKSITFIDDNRIDLTRTGPIERKSRAMPEMKKNRTYFCVMSQEPHSPSLSQRIVNTIMYSSIWRILQSLTHKEIQQEFQDFQCLNAFGVSTADAHHSEKTMFLLFDGVDNVNGFPYASNIFHVGNGSKFIQGGDCDDYFKIIAENVNGIFNAGHGYDTLDLSEFSHQPLTIRGGIAVQRYAGRLESFEFANIESIIGRRNYSDYLSVCNQSRIDLAGTNYNPDEVLIRNDGKNDCVAPKNLTVYLRRTTNVICQHPEAKVTYLVMRDTIAIVKAYNGSHHFYFQGLDLIDITVVTFDEDTLFLKFGDKEAGSSLIVNNLSNVCMEFNDGVKIKSSGNSLVAHLERPETLFDVIEKYDQFIKNNKFMTLVAETIQGRAILHHDHNLIEINGTSKSMNIIVNSDKLDVDLIGQVNASNYFLLFGNQFDWSHVIDLKIYTNNSMSYIDLHLLARSIHQKTNGEDGLHVWAKKSLDDTTNIELKIQAMPNKDDVAPIDLGKITIINGIKNIDKILINIYNTNFLSLIDENVGKVTLDPLLSCKSGSIIAILPGQLDFYSKISVDSLLGENFEPFFVNGTLMLTNLASQAIFLEVENQMMTIFLYDFKMYKNKYRTIDLVFKDKTLKLDNYVKMSSGIKPIDAFWNKLDE